MTSLSVPRAAPRRLDPGSALWLTVSIVIMFLAASSAPSPLYGLYREMWGFSALGLTLVFSSYALVLLAALLVFGSLSDHLGRRPVILVALLIEFASIVVFWQAQSMGWLLAARVLQGLATGVATSAISALLVDLHPTRGALLNSVAPMLGMALGALGTSFLVQYLPAPTHLVFELLLFVIALQFVGAWYLPDTLPRRPGAWRSLLPRMHVPQPARAPLWRILPLSTAGWALGGFYLSLGPTLAKVVTGQASVLVGGALISALVLPGALAIYVVRQRPPRGVLTASALALASGLVVTLGGVWWGSSAAFFGGTLIAGLGFGAGFNAALRCLVPLAAPQDRAGLLASFFALSYLAFSLPAMAAGLLAGLWGVSATAMAYGALLVALAGMALETARSLEP